MSSVLHIISCQDKTGNEAINHIAYNLNMYSAQKEMERIVKKKIKADGGERQLSFQKDNINEIKTDASLPYGLYMIVINEDNQKTVHLYEKYEVPSTWMSRAYAEVKLLEIYFISKLTVSLKVEEKTNTVDDVKENDNMGYCDVVDELQSVLSKMGSQMTNLKPSELLPKRVRNTVEKVTTEPKEKIVQENNYTVICENATTVTEEEEPLLSTNANKLDQLLEEVLKEF